jgi:hypothetical protein
MKIAMCTANGEEHGLIGTLSNNVPFDGFKNMKPETKAKCEKQKKDDSVVVKARYLNKRGKHERLTKPYCRWSGEPIQMYHLIPGHVYDLPRGFIDEVNAIKVKKRSGLVSVNGEPLNRDESPLESDQDDEALHQLVPANF